MNPARLLLLIFLFAFLVSFIQIGLFTIAFDKLGISPVAAYFVLIASLLGSLINLPLFTLNAAPPRPDEYPQLIRLWQIPIVEFSGKTVIAINVGGGLIPLLCSLYLLEYHALHVGEVVFGIAGVAAISHLFSRPVRGMGIGMPLFIAPFSAALLALIINPEQSAPLAYICGTLGVLLGADILRLKDIPKLGVPMAAIGGAGTFDGIFITGIVAVLLA